jgi:hypothetical protein
MDSVQRLNYRLEQEQEPKTEESDVRTARTSSGGYLQDLAKEHIDRFDHSVSVN